MANQNLTNFQALAKYRTALENVERQPKIAEAMAKHGYGSEKIAEGIQIFEKTYAAYDFKNQQKDEASVAYLNFEAKRQELSDIYRLHRKKAKIVFRKDLIALKRLDLEGRLPRTYAEWLWCIRRFYAGITKNAMIQERLLRLKVTAEELALANEQLTALDQARSGYLRKKGASQQATKDKDAAFAKMGDWMSEFYALAKIALIDNPQLLEALGVLVRS